MNTTWPTRQVIGSPSSRYAFAATLYFPCTRRLLTKAPQERSERYNKMPYTAANHVCKEECITYGRDLFRDINHLGQNHLICLDGALKIDLTDVVAEVKCLFDQSNKTIFDSDFNLSTFLNSFVESARGFDSERLPTRLGVSILRYKGYYWRRLTEQVGSGPNRLYRWLEYRRW